jgi:hypothetical protein
MRRVGPHPRSSSMTRPAELQTQVGQFSGARSNARTLVHRSDLMPLESERRYCFSGSRSDDEKRPSSLDFRSITLLGGYQDAPRELVPCCHLIQLNQSIVQFVLSPTISSIRAPFSPAGDTSIGATQSQFQGIAADALAMRIAIIPKWFWRFCIPRHILAREPRDLASRT